MTGLGVLAPNGLDTETCWEALLNGESGVDHIRRFDTTGFRVTFGAELKEFDAERFGLDRRMARRNDLCTQYAICCAQMAVTDADLDLDAGNPDRMGVIFGSGIGGIWTFEDQHTVLLEKGARRISPFFIPMMIPDMTSGQVSILLGARGPNYTTVSACSSAAHAIGCAFREIRHNEAEVMVTGGAEAAVSAMSLGGFASMKALSHAQRGSAGCQPSLRPGARRIRTWRGLRGAHSRRTATRAAAGALAFTPRLLVRVLPPTRITSPTWPRAARGGARAMRIALNQAGLNPEDVDYINAHGTSTPIGDRTETAAIKSVLGNHARQAAVSSTKSMTGHLLGASGAIESIACLLAIHHGRVPPTINYEHPDPECDLDYVPNTAREMPVSVALNNSFGFGGHNAVLAMREYNGR